MGLSQTKQSQMDAAAMLQPIRKPRPLGAAVAPCCNEDQLSADVQVFILDYVFDGMMAHVSRNTELECGGVLMGQFCQDPLDISFIQVVGFIPAKGAVATSASIRFTVESWQFISNERVAFGDLPIVGWYHSHPGHGIFLSQGMDSFVHMHWFPYPWQVALVLDPINAHYGLFGWRDGELTREPVRFYLVS